MLFWSNQRKLIRSDIIYLDFVVDLVEGDSKAVAVAVAVDDSKHFEEEEDLDCNNHLAADFYNPFQI